MTEGKHCSVCNEVLVAQTEVPATGHSYDAVVTNPTCTAQGYTTYTCSVCGDTYVDNYVDALGHTEVVDAAVAATCTETGLTEGKHCSVCNEVLVAQTEVPATGHSYDAVVTNPTCTAQGYTTYTCSVCGDTYVDNYVDALGHTEVVDAAVAPTCTATGLTEGKHCSVCNEVLVAQTVVAATGHTEVVDAAVAATCTATGLTEGKHCSVCGEVLVAQTVVDALGHDEVAHEAQAATCTEKGWNAYVTCSRCDYTTYEEIGALGHDEVAHEAKAATCTEIGWNAYVTCSRCDYTTYSEIAALGHNTEGTVAHKDATCTEAGVVGGTYCTRCNEGKAAAEEVIEATGEHNYGEWIEEVAATCMTEGTLGHYTCSVCEKNFDENKEELNSLVIAIDKTAHTAVDGTCTGCGLVFVGTDEQGVQYTLSADETEYAVSGYSKATGASTDVIIPAEYNGLPVTELNDNAFKTKNAITTLKIPASVTYISDDALAFRESSALTAITVDEENKHFKSIDGNLYSINENGDPVALVRYAFGNADVNTFEITETVTELYKNAFRNATYLKEIENLDNITTLGQYAFAYTGLTSATIYESWVYVNDEGKYCIPRYTFYNCTKLESVVFLNSITFIAGNTFEKCTALTAVYYTGTAEEFNNIEEPGSTNAPFINATKYYYSEEEPALNDEGTAYNGNYWKYDTDGTIVVWEYIPEGACTHTGGTATCTAKAVCTTCGEEYGEYAACADENADTFCDTCGGTVDLAYTAVDGGYQVAAYTGSATEIVIPATHHGQSVISIAEKAFYQNDTITAVTIPEGVITIGTSAFNTCSALTSVTIPASVTTIGDAAFNGCSGLTGVYITDIAAWCGISFNTASSNPLYAAGAKNLYVNNELVTELVIPEGVTSIGDYAFRAGKNFVSLTIPSSVTSIGDGAFYGCSGLTSVTIEEGVTAMGYCMFQGCTVLKSIVIPTTITEISARAFYGCSKLTSIILPNTVTSIAAEAFRSTNVFEAVYYTGTEEEFAKINVVDTSNDSFINATKYYNVKTEGTEGLGYELSEDGTYYIVKEYTGEATDVVIPVVYEGKLVSEIYSEGKGKAAAFQGNTTITSVTIPGSVTTMGDYAFASCTALTSVTFEEGFTAIDGIYAFSGCSSLATVNLPSTLKSISRNAFASNTSLKTLVIPEGVETIGYRAFRGCTSLKSMVLPNSLKTLGGQVFTNGTSIEKIYYTGTEEEWNTMFSSISDSYDIASLEAATKYYVGEWEYVDGVPTAKA